MRTVPSPNYTQIPNEVLDEWMRVLTGVELKVVMFICRKTFGWHKESDEISLSQIIDGTGAGKTQVVEALKGLQENKYVHVSKTSGKTNSYHIVVRCPENEQVDEGLVRKPNRTSSETGPVLVQFPNTQKKDLNKDKEKDSIDSKESKKVKKHTEEEQILFHEIEHTFKEFNPDYYPSGKERSSIYKIIKRGKDKDKIAMVVKCFFMAHDGRLEKLQFLADRPLTPSMVLCYWDHVVNYIKQDMADKQRNGYIQT